MNALPRLVLPCLLALAGGAANLSAASAPPDDSGRFVFSLLPKAFQRDPAVDMAMITEVTDAGRKLALPTGQHPLYYIAQSSGYHDEGGGVLGEKPLPADQLEISLKKSLATSHYLPAEAGHPATQVIFFVWGSHNKLDPTEPDSDSAESKASNDLGHQNLLSRAALVGGMKFAQDFERALNEHDKMLLTGIAGFGPDPVSIFMNRDAKTTRLVEQAYDDCYYVVASAYDAFALAKGRRTLLWRTKMTTNSRGLSMAQSLPLLITGGGPYFGRDMSEAVTLTRRVIPDGQVKVGKPVEVPGRDSSH